MICFLLHLFSCSFQIPGTVLIIYMSASLRITGKVYWMKWAMISAVHSEPYISGSYWGRGWAIWGAFHIFGIRWWPGIIPSPERGRIARGWREQPGHPHASYVTIPSSRSGHGGSRTGTWSCSGNDILLVLLIFFFSLTVRSLILYIALTSWYELEQFLWQFFLWIWL